MNIPFNLLVLKVFNAQKNRVRPLMAAIGLSPGQPKILTFLALHGACRQKELAASCDIEPATISRLLQGLEEQGLIVRSGAADDRRAARVELSEHGRELYRTEVAPRFRSVVAAELTGFSEAERSRFEEYLRRVYFNLTSTPLEF